MNSREAFKSTIFNNDVMWLECYRKNVCTYNTKYSFHSQSNDTLRWRWFFVDTVHLNIACRSLSLSRLPLSLSREDGNIALKKCVLTRASKYRTTVTCTHRHSHHYHYTSTTTTTTTTRSTTIFVQMLVPPCVLSNVNRTWYLKSYGKSLKTYMKKIKGHFHYQHSQQNYLIYHFYHQSTAITNTTTTLLLLPLSQHYHFLYCHHHLHHQFHCTNITTTISLTTQSSLTFV